MKFTILLALILISTISNAQKIITVKKGNIKLNDSIIATFDGKGGNAFRMGSYKINIPGQLTPFLTITEDNTYNLNPLFEVFTNYFEFTFENGEKYFYRPKEKTGKVFGTKMDYRPRITGNDIIEVLFNDTVLPFVVNNKVEYNNVKTFFTNNNFDRIAYIANIKQTEDTIARYTNYKINRDVAKPIVLNLIKLKYDYLTWYNIIQDDVVIGRLSKSVMNYAIYTVWKKTSDKVTLNNEIMEFAPILVTKNLSPSDVVSKTCQYNNVVGKAAVGFICSDYANAEYDLINAVIKSGGL